MVFSNVLDAAGQADASPADAGQSPVAGKTDGDDKGGVADSVAASIILLFSGFEFPANTISPPRESTANDMQKGENIPVTDSSSVAASSVLANAAAANFVLANSAAGNSVADAAIKVADSKQLGAIPEIPQDFFSYKAASPVGHVEKPDSDAQTMNAPVDAVSSDAFASIAALVSTGNATPLNAAIPATQSDTDKAVTANAVVSGQSVNMSGSIPSARKFSESASGELGAVNLNDINVRKEAAAINTETATFQTEGLTVKGRSGDVNTNAGNSGISTDWVSPVNTVNAAEARNPKTDNPAVIAGVTVSSIKVASGVAEPAGSQGIRQKAVPKNNVSEVSAMEAEAVAVPETETTVSVGRAVDISETFGRLDLAVEPKNETGKDSAAQGNLTAINAYNTVRSMDSTSGVSESAASAELAESPDVRASIVEQLHEPVTRAINRGADHIRLHLQPEGLGDLRVSIRMVNGGVRLDIVTDKILSRQILEQGLPELKSYMRDDGISIKSMNVEYGGADEHETPRRRDDEHPPYRHNHGRRRENFAGYFA